MALFSVGVPPGWWGPMAFAAFGSFAVGFIEWVRVWQLPGSKRRKVKDPVDYVVWAVGFPLIAAGLARRTWTRTSRSRGFWRSRSVPPPPSSSNGLRA